MAATVGSALAVREQVQASRAIEPANMSELVTFATAAAKSRLFGVDSPEAALMVAMAGRDLGFSYAQSLRAFHIVKGKPALSADGMVAACLASGECEFFRAVEVTDDSATWETKRRGSQVRRYTFTMADAQRAGLASDMYAKHPRRMLSARAKSYLARDEFPDVLLGLVTEDEAVEIAASREPVQFVQTTRTVEPEPDAALDDSIRARDFYVHAIGSADSEQALAQIAADVKAARGIADPHMADIRKAFAARQKVLRARPAPATEEHDAEPVEAAQ